MEQQKKISVLSAPSERQKTESPEKKNRYKKDESSKGQMVFNKLVTGRLQIVEATVGTFFEPSLLANDKRAPLLSC